MAARHRNPRPRVPRPPSPDNQPRRHLRGFHPPRALQEMRAAFRDLVTGNPAAASAVLDLLEIVASGNRRRAMALVEAASMLVAPIRGAS